MLLHDCGFVEESILWLCLFDFASAASWLKGKLLQE
jgi:hypothetical protein